jgi:hypothetical protein
MLFQPARIVTKPSYYVIRSLDQERWNVAIACSSSGADDIHFERNCPSCLITTAYIASSFTDW